MTMLYIVLMLVAFGGYANKKYVLFLVCMLGLVSRFFMLDTTEDVIATIKGSDLALFLMFVLLPIAYKRAKYLFSVHGDSLARWTYIFLAFYVLELFVTVFLGHENFFNSLKVIRSAFFMCGFFILRIIPLDYYKRFLKIALWITLIQTALYFLQFVGVSILSGERDIPEDADYYKTNIPTLALLFICLLWNFEYLKKKRFILIAVLFAVVLASFVRGTIIAVLFGLFYYTAFISKGRKRFFMMILLLITIPLALRFINKKAEISGSSQRGLEEIELVINQRNHPETISSEDGTLAFRIAMLFERADWLKNNPKYLLTGVGTMHEDSPKTLQMFDFSLGTRNEERFYGRTIIESGDIAWVPIVLRYGIIGVFIHLMMFFLLFHVTRKRKDLLVMFSVYAIIAFMRTLDGAYFELPSLVFIHMLLFVIVSRSNLENKPLIL